MREINNGNTSPFKTALNAVLNFIKSKQQFTVPVLLFVCYAGFISILIRKVSFNILGIGTRPLHVLGSKKLDLTKEEFQIAEQCVVDPDKIDDTFDSIGGLEDVKECIEQHVIWPVNHPEMFEEGGYGGECGNCGTSGVLLYGPPGTGKTMLARVIAKSVNGFFIEIKPEELFGKYVGDTEKCVAAVFSLARKLGTAVIFIDEIDALLSSRTSSDGQAYANAKTIFMTKWDGLDQCDKDVKIIIIGATNRRDALDAAILRRLSVQQEVPYPNIKARDMILRCLLKKELIRAEDGDDDDGSGSNNMYKTIGEIAKVTDGYSGAILKQLVSSAHLVRLKGIMRRYVKDPQRQQHDGGNIIGNIIGEEKNKNNNKYEKNDRNDKGGCQTSGATGPSLLALPHQQQNVPLSFYHFSEASKFLAPEYLFTATKREGDIKLDKVLD